MHQSSRKVCGVSSTCVCTLMMSSSGSLSKERGTASCSSVHSVSHSAHSASKWPNSCCRKYSSRCHQNLLCPFPATPASQHPGWAVSSSQMGWCWTQQQQEPMGIFPGELGGGRLAWPHPRPAILHGDWPVWRKGPTGAFPGMLGAQRPASNRGSSSSLHHRHAGLGQALDRLPA